MNATVIRLIANIVVIATVHTNYGMQGKGLNPIDKELFVRYIGATDGPNAIKQMMVSNKAEYDAHDTCLITNEGGLHLNPTRYSPLTFESYLYPEDPSVKHIFDAIDQLEKQQGSARPSYTLLLEGGMVLAHLTKCTDYAHKLNASYHTPHIRCVTSFSAEHLPALEQLLNTHSSTE